MKTEMARCGVCGATEEIQPIEGRLPDLPPDWTVVSVHDRPEINRVLCPVDAARVRQVLHG